ncbi:predicted protein [Streptomyces viridosporus ATCC 14672]|uniref:Predicted protein n=1 Tax=Streptomyces viridosporus (strain ATCC 14672 / DSM 40746 / JCM 4963 / KCTC 9882 / NRRL B-12104 / FH 1290) TaxID=566461 RepID=D6A0F2_STRV1|nr:hypothetical protein [Streptomyces viridosporus]EFE67373.1 predicted protein [Streptomyces viridosporus ATCC 14672]
MTARAGEPFDTNRAASGIEAALSAPVPTAGPTADEGEPATGEWTVTRGEGFLLLPLWESEALTGVYGARWNDAEAAAEANLAALVAELDRRWGPHRTLSMRVPLHRGRTGEPLPEPFRTLAARDCYGDLAVWGPVRPGGPPAAPRWLALSLNQSDGDAPMIMTALISDRPLTEPADRD